MKRLIGMIKTAKSQDPKGFRDVKTYRSSTEQRQVTKGSRLNISGALSSMRKQSSEQIQSIDSIIPGSIPTGTTGDKVLMKDDKNVILGASLSQQISRLAPTLATQAW